MKISWNLSTQNTKRLLILCFRKLRIWNTFIYIWLFFSREILIQKWFFYNFQQFSLFYIFSSCWVVQTKSILIAHKCFLAAMYFIIVVLLTTCLHLAPLSQNTRKKPFLNIPIEFRTILQEIDPLFQWIRHVS